MSEWCESSRRVLWHNVTYIGTHTRTYARTHARTQSCKNFNAPIYTHTIWCISVNFEYWISGISTHFQIACQVGVVKYVEDKTNAYTGFRLSFYVYSVLAKLPGGARKERLPYVSHTQNPFQLFPAYPHW